MNVQLTMEQAAWLEDLLSRAHTSDPYSDNARSMRRRLLLNYVEDMMQEAYTAGAESRSVEDIDDARAEGYEYGYEEGYDTGHDTGHDAGHETGFDAGYVSGYEEGHDAGYDSAREACNENGGSI